MLKVPWELDSLLRAAYARKGQASASDVGKLYDTFAAAKAQGRTRYAAQLLHDHRQALEAEHARRHPVTPSAAPVLKPRVHLDEVERLRSEGKTRMAAALEERHAGVLAIERAARAAEVQEWQRQQAAMIPPEPVTTETQPPPPKPRKHLDVLDGLRARGQTREAELAGQPEPLSVFEVTAAAPSTWASALEGKK